MTKYKFSQTIPVIALKKPTKDLQKCGGLKKENDLLLEVDLFCII